jgi:hypothetical protein
VPADLFKSHNLLDHAGAFLKSFRASGGRGIGLCHLHNDTRPSLAITPRSWRCHGCNAEGGILDFYIRIARMSKSEALEFVKSHNGTPVLLPAPKPEPDVERLEARVMAAMENIEDAISYLSSRGIEVDVAGDWCLGCLNGRLTIPYYDQEGRLKGIAERALHDQIPKYNYTTGMKKSELLFGLDRVRDDERLALCEGFFDCISLNLAGIPAVALGGVDLCDTQIELLMGREIVVAMDGDESGRQAASRITELLHAAGIGAVIADPGDDLDPDDRTRRDGNADWVDFWRGIPTVEAPSTPEVILDRPSLADVISSPDLMAREFENQPNIVGRFWPHGGQGIVAAQFGSYKTGFLQTLSRDLARGHSTLRGWDVDRPYKVLYVDFELPLQHIQRRFASALGNTEPPENLYWLSADTLLQYGGLDLGSEDGQTIFLKILDELKPDVVIIETIIGAFSSHNPAFEPADAQDFTRFVSNLRLMGYACLWSAHTTKKESGGLAYGSNFQNTGMDFILSLSRGSEEGLFDLKFLKQRWEPVDEPELKLEIRFEESGTEIVNHGHSPDSESDLLRLIHMKKPKNQAELAKVLGQSESTASRKSNALRKLGLVQEGNLVLTERGFLLAGISSFEED